MDVKEAILTAKNYIRSIYEDENASDIGLEEVEFDDARDRWIITVSFSRPSNASRTRAQDVLERMTAGMPLKRASKILTIADGGRVLSMKDRIRAEAAG